MKLGERKKELMMKKASYEARKLQCGLPSALTSGWVCMIIFPCPAESSPVSSMKVNVNKVLCSENGAHLFHTLWFKCKDPIEQIYSPKRKREELVSMLIPIPLSTCHKADCKITV